MPGFRYLKTRYKRPKRLPVGLFSWMRKIFNYNERDILEIAGMDAVMYFRIISFWWVSETNAWSSDGGMRLAPKEYCARKTREQTARVEWFFFAMYHGLRWCYPISRSCKAGKSAHTQSLWSAELTRVPGLDGVCLREKTNRNVRPRHIGG